MCGSLANVRVILGNGHFRVRRTSSLLQSGKESLTFPNTSPTWTSRSTSSATSTKFCSMFTLGPFCACIPAFARRGDLSFPICACKAVGFVESSTSICWCSASALSFSFSDSRCSGVPLDLGFEQVSRPQSTKTSQAHTYSVFTVKHAMYLQSQRRTSKVSKQLFKTPRSVTQSRFDNLRPKQRRIFSGRDGRGNCAER